jgi:hypothetical protein
MPHVFPVEPERYAVPSNPNFWDAPAVNTQAVLNFAAVPGQRHAIYKILWSYDALPTGGQIDVVDAGGNRLAGPFYITSGGVGFIPMTVVGRMNGAIRVLLAAVAGVSGSIGVQAYFPHVG